MFPTGCLLAVVSDIACKLPLSSAMLDSCLTGGCPQTAVSDGKAIAFPHRKQSSQLSAMPSTPGPLVVAPRSQVPGTRGATDSFFSSFGLHQRIDWENFDGGNGGSVITPSALCVSVQQQMVSLVSRHWKFSATKGNCANVRKPTERADRCLSDHGAVFALHDRGGFGEEALENQV